MSVTGSLCGPGSHCRAAGMWIYAVKGKGCDGMLSLMVRFHVWLGTVRDRLMEPDESNRALTVLTAVLGWLVSMVAVQYLVVLCVYGVVNATGNTLEGGWFGPLSMLVSAASSVLAFFPLLLLPGVRDALCDRRSSWFRSPSFSDGRVMPWWYIALLSALVAILGFGVVQLGGWLVGLVSGSSGSNEVTGLMGGLTRGLLSGTVRLPWAVVLSLVLMVVVLPFMEEVLFRGVVTRLLLYSGFVHVGSDVQGRVSWLRGVAACVIGGVLFGAVHLITASGAGDMLLVFSCMSLLGTLFGIADWRTESVWVSVGAHVMYNALNVMVMVAW